ncbi:MAG TPA: hypothetical protein VGI86_06335 [Acidimicrobiia bacterium]|jgi:glucose/arabinose dehydrogenase
MSVKLMHLRRVIATVIAIAIGTASLAACASKKTSDSLVDIGAGLEGPSGLRASVYARGLKNVAALAFDSSGRLWAATASYTDTGTDAVYVIAKSGAAPAKVLANVQTPLGLLWHDGALYVASKRQVTVYRDFDGSTFSSKREILTLPAGIGEVNQLALAPNGRMLLGISSACDHCSTTTKDSAAILSFLPDGTDVQTYATGIRAPVGLAFYPGTSDLFVSMNQRDDLGSRTPGDWLSVVRQGDNWRFPGCYGQGGAACRSVPGPVAVLDKHAAVSGVAIVTDQLGARVATSALVAEWADGKVVRVALTETGSTYTGTVHSFLTGLKNPVPVVLRGTTLFVGDWGSGIVYAVANAKG